MTDTWDAARQEIAALATSTIDDWVTPHPALVQSALDLATLMQGLGFDAPHAVFPMPDGCINLSWFAAGGSREYEVQGVGRGELMTIARDSKTTFTDLTWPRVVVSARAAAIAELLAAAEDAVETHERGGMPGGPILRLRSAAKAMRDSLEEPTQ